MNWRGLIIVTNYSQMNLLVDELTVEGMVSIRSDDNYEQM